MAKFSQLHSTFKPTKSKGERGGNPKKPVCQYSPNRMHLMGPMSNVVVLQRLFDSVIPSYAWQIGD